MDEIDTCIINRAGGPYEEIFVLTFKVCGPNEVICSSGMQ